MVACAGGRWSRGVLGGAQRQCLESAGSTTLPMSPASRTAVPLAIMVVMPPPPLPHSSVSRSTLTPSTALAPAALAFVRSLPSAMARADSASTALSEAHLANENVADALIRVKVALMSPYSCTIWTPAARGTSSVLTSVRRRGERIVQGTRCGMRCSCGLQMSRSAVSCRSTVCGALALAAASPSIVISTLVGQHSLPPVCCVAPATSGARPADIQKSARRTIVFSTQKETRRCSLQGAGRLAWDGRWPGPWGVCSRRWAVLFVAA